MPTVVTLPQSIVHCQKYPKKVALGITMWFQPACSPLNDHQAMSSRAPERMITYILPTVAGEAMLTHVDSCQSGVLRSIFTSRVASTPWLAPTSNAKPAFPLCVVTVLIVPADQISASSNVATVGPVLTLTAFCIGAICTSSM